MLATFSSEDRIHPGEKQASIPAKVLRAELAGQVYRVQLATKQGQLVSLDVPREEFERQGLWKGSDVFISAKDMALFQEDFMI
jgi:hypothetical protein